MFEFSIPTDKSVDFPLRCVRTCLKINLDITAETTSHQAMCQNELIATVNHSWSGAVANTTLSWDVVPDGVFGAATSFYGAPTSPGVYTWTITAQHNEEICPPTISTGTITVNARPATVVISGITPACDSTILTASNGNSGTIFWQNTTSNGLSTDAINRTSTATVKTSGTYYFRARSDEGCWGHQSSRAIVINTAPTIHSHPNTTNQSIVQNGTFPALSVSASGSTPISYQWFSNTTRSNTGGALIPGATNSAYTPSSATVGTLYYYCVVTNTCGTDTSNVSGAHIVEPPPLPPPAGCNNNTPGWGSDLGTVSFVTNQEWMVGNQIWSDAVQATNCNNKGTFDGGSLSSANFNADCRSNPGYKGDLFSWCAVVRFANTLCPDNWRVPTAQEFFNLDIELGGTGGNTNNGIIRNNYLDRWGGTFSGICNVAGAFENRGGGGLYWSQTEAGTSTAINTSFYSGGTINPQGHGHKGNGMPVRCVRNP
jgi:uncharacterized protein (TIGR02145 family)